ncbi:hypothetical protein XELAEV_18010530mg [Xenopus laevis]|uniref:Uncharacterized protein n=1 Tax=Xenopus laevis TaxID=8355 RepID=A0A974I1L9_XENLA|nr:hypothetical protein XELAEV_18010530mg [Xenopus laevis]
MPGTPNHWLSPLPNGESRDYPRIPTCLLHFKWNWRCALLSTLHGIKATLHVCYMYEPVYLHLDSPARCITNTGTYLPAIL